MKLELELTITDDQVDGLTAATEAYNAALPEGSLIGLAELLAAQTDPDAKAAAAKRRKTLEAYAAQCLIDRLDRFDRERRETVANELARQSVDLPRAVRLGLIETVSAGIEAAGGTE